MQIDEYKKLITKQNKYGAHKSTYKGKIYDSTKEANFARELDILRSAHRDSDRVVGVKRQVKYPVFINELPVFKYIADFKVRYADGSEKVFDVKGMKSGGAYAHSKKKCVEAYYYITIIEV